MPTSYLPYAPDQQLLLPHSLQEWLPQGHLAHYINDTIDTLDLSAFFKRYQGGGSRNQPFHPAMMVKVLVYGYATGVFSSRKIAKKLHEDVAFRVLAADNFPKPRTLSDFRALHLEELAALFVQVVKLARECGLVKLGTIEVDGTKLRAKASKHKAMSYECMQAREIELKAQIDTLLKRSAHLEWLSWRRWLDIHGVDKLQPERWLYFNYAHQIAQAALSGQGLALSRMPLIADALAAGDLLEVLPQHRIDTPLAYWLMVGPRSAQRPEVKAFCTWLAAQAEITRAAIGDGPDPDTQDHLD